MKKEDLIKKAKDKVKKDSPMKQYLAEEIIKRLTKEQKVKLLDKFKEKYKNHKDYVELVERFKKDIKYG